MATKRTLALILLVPFALLTLYAVQQVGYVGIFDYHRHSPAGWQVFADLVVALVLVLSWLIPEAREESLALGGRYPVPRVHRTAAVPGVRACRRQRGWPGMTRIRRAG